MRRHNRRIGTLLFVIPVVVILALVVVGIYSNNVTNKGVLVVEAQSVYRSSSVFISANATLSGATRPTPFNESLIAGSYTVTYSPLAWYQTPPPKVVQVGGGQVSYSVGVYSPTLTHVSVSQSGFNATKVTVGRGITPVVWVNTGTTTVELESVAFTVFIPPSLNYTHIFRSGSSVNVFLGGSSAEMVVAIE